MIVHATTLVAFGAPLSDGGNTFGAPASVGTNDNFDMRIRTNNANRVVIKTDGRVGIGTNAPGATLEVAGTVKFTGGAPGAGKVLTSDVAGLASWLAPTGVTSVNSANLYLSVANTTTTPIITANVGTLANTLAAGNDSRITNALQSSVYAADLAPVTSCAPSSKPSWNTITDLWECNSIGSLNASVLSSGTVDSARLGSGLASPTTFLRGDGTWATPSPAINIATGTGLTGGPITSSGTISLADTAVTAGTYGSATQVAQFTVDSQGRIVSANNVPITGGTPSGANQSLSNLSSTAINVDLLPNITLETSLGSNTKRFAALYIGFGSFLNGISTPRIYGTSTNLSLEINSNTNEFYLSSSYGSHLGFTQTQSGTVNVQPAAGIGATCNVNGGVGFSDSVGTIDLTTGSNSWSSGSQCQVAFAMPWNIRVVCVISPNNAVSAAAISARQVYVNPSQTMVDLSFGQADTQNNSYSFSYHCLGKN